MRLIQIASIIEQRLAPHAAILLLHKTRERRIRAATHFVQLLRDIRSFLLLAIPTPSAHGPVCIPHRQSPGRPRRCIQAQRGHERGGLQESVELPRLNDRLPVQFDAVAAHAVADRVRDLEFVSPVAEHFLELESRVVRVKMLSFRDETGRASERPRGLGTVVIRIDNQPPVILTGLGHTRGR